MCADGDVERARTSRTGEDGRGRARTGKDGGGSEVAIGGGGVRRGATHQRSPYDATDRLTDKLGQSEFALLDDCQ